MNSETVLLLTIALIHGFPRGKGSDSFANSEEQSGEVTDNEKAQETKTGLQHKFWIPTYHGTNPLGRKKISITTSEIDRYDKTIDVSLSGVYRKSDSKKQNKDVNLSMQPFDWSGENVTNNITIKDLPSLDSNEITLEDSSSLKGSHLKNIGIKSPKTGHKVLERLPKDIKPQEKIKSEIPLSLKQSSSQSKNVDTKIKNQNKMSSRIALTKPEWKNITVSNTAIIENGKLNNVEKPVASQIFNDLSKNNNTKLTREYYTQLVKDATKNTKIKLGYKNLSKITKKQQKSVQQNIDKTRFKTPKNSESIIFETQHNQFFNKTLQDKEQRVRSLKGVLDLKFGKSILHANKSNLAPNEKTVTMVKELQKIDFPLSCDYDAWSDILLKNKTERKSNLRKPKIASISSSFERSSGYKKWPRTKIKNKVDELREKKSKISKKTKRKRAQKNKEQRKSKKVMGKYTSQDNEETYDYEYSDQNKKLRMRTKGEKQHAIKEVKEYLKEMDGKYGGRPGGDTYYKEVRRGSEKNRYAERSYGKQIRSGKGSQREFVGGFGREQRKGFYQKRGSRWSDKTNTRFGYREGDRRVGRRDYRGQGANRRDDRKDFRGRRDNRGVYRGRSSDRGVYRGRSSDSRGFRRNTDRYPQKDYKTDVRRDGNYRKQRKYSEEEDYGKKNKGNRRKEN